jgi:transmembrane 9 superfamily protein 2/4
LIGTLFRPIPDKPWILGWLPCLVVGGALPFGACYVELYFVLSSLWTDSYYCLFGFLLLALALLALTCALVAVVLTYFLLCAEDPRWGWRAFGCAAATGAFVLAYSAVFFSHLEANQPVRDVRI